LRTALILTLITTLTDNEVGPVVHDLVMCRPKLTGNESHLHALLLLKQNSS